MQENSVTQRDFLPAAGRDWLLPLYDPLSKLLGSAAAHRQLVEQAKLAKGQRVLEVGCGTGNLALLVKSIHPDVEVVGMDPDPKALARAIAKARQRRLDVRFELGFADATGSPDRAFDAVFSAFMFHHLKPDEKAASLQEIRRVLRTGGRLHLLDFAGEASGAHGLAAHLFHRHGGHSAEHEPSLIDQLRQAGFAAAAEVGHRRNLVGRIAWYRGVSVD